MPSSRTSGPAEVFPPGEFIREELEARGLTQEELAEIMGRPAKAVSQIIRGKKQITPPTAKELASAFGTSPEMWLNLETAYRLSLSPGPGGEVARRRRIHELAPVKELLERQWIEPSGSDLDSLEEAICRFLGIVKIDDEPQVRFAARASAAHPRAKVFQRAWVCRARHLAARLKPARYDADGLESAVSSLARRSADPAAVAELPCVLAKLGVRLVFVPHLRNTKIDGASFWLDSGRPAIALSLRYDRIDNFWFTLLHELAHVLLHARDHRAIVDNRLVGRDSLPLDHRSAQERHADEQAAKWLVPSRQLEEFVKRERPYFSREKIIDFAGTLGVHPGIVEGRLQYEGEVGYNHLRELLVKVRGFVKDAGLLDQI
jgi:HTH-type transcriptional regulator/antitoxin HigA